MAAPAEDTGGRGSSLEGVLGSEMVARLRTPESDPQLWSDILDKWSLYQNENEELSVQREKEKVVKGTNH